MKNDLLQRIASYAEDPCLTSYIGTDINSVQTQLKDLKVQIVFIEQFRYRLSSLGS